MVRVRRECGGSGIVSEQRSVDTPQPSSTFLYQSPIERLHRNGLRLNAPSVRTLDRRQYLSRIEDVLRIERLLQSAHGLDRFRAEFGLEVLLLALPDAVLSGASAAHRLRAFHQAMYEVLAARHFLVIVDVARQRAVEIAVADMADNRRQQIEAFEVRFGFGHAIGETGNRHAHIRGHYAGARTQGLYRPIS